MASCIVINFLENVFFCRENIPFSEITRMVLIVTMKRTLVKLPSIPGTENGMHPGQGPNQGAFIWQVGILWAKSLPRPACIDAFVLRVNGAAVLSSGRIPALALCHPELAECCLRRFSLVCCCLHVWTKKICQLLMIVNTTRIADNIYFLGIAVLCFGWTWTYS